MVKRFVAFVDEARTIPTKKYLMNIHSFQPPIELSYEMLHFGHPSSQTTVMAHGTDQDVVMLFPPKKANSKGKKEVSRVFTKGPIYNISAQITPLEIH